MKQTPMEDAIVEFDTNGYRSFCQRDLASGPLTTAALRGRERRKRIRALANPYVIMELASHLWDERDPHYDSCRRSLAALAEHCSSDHGQIGILADAESLVARMLCGRTPPSYRETTESLTRLTKGIADLGSGPMPPDFVSMCRELADHIDQCEKTFVEDMRLVVRQMNPSCEGWDPFSADNGGRKHALEVVQSKSMLKCIAGAFVVKAHHLLRVPLDYGSAFEDRTTVVLDSAAVSIALYCRILEKLVVTGADMSKKQRANSIWDLQICFGIGQKINGQELSLITANRGIVEAAKAVSFGAYVKSVDEYLTALQ